MKFRTIAVLAGALASAWLGAAEPAKSPASTSSPVLAPLEAIYPDLEKLSIDLHQNPELSFHEEKTAAKMADRLRALGYQVTTGVGKTGVVGVLRNGKGPTVMLRTDLDALPVEEKTGLNLLPLKPDGRFPSTA